MKSEEFEKNKVQIMTLFPTPLGLFNLGRDLTENELRHIVSLETRSNISNSLSLDKNILDSQLLKNLSQFINDSLQTYFNEIYRPNLSQYQLYITQSWANYSKLGEAHHKHNHPNSIISGVFYVQADESKDKIYFSSGTHKTIKMTPIEYNIFNSDVWWIPVKTGRLLLFPSDLMHYVEKTTSPNTRISISFNTFVKGNIGDSDMLTYLELK